MENKKREIRLLRADEIECRVATISPKGLSLLLYKDARVDQNILDETFGIYGWKREHVFMGDVMFCTVSVLNEKGEWIGKQDVGVPSYAEPVNGAASDAFKRACFNWGIGRELYTAPFIWIPKEQVDIRQEEKRYITKDRFQVDFIEYDEKSCISVLKIKNQRKQVVFAYGSGIQEESRKKTDNKPQASVILQEKWLRKEMERTGVSEKMICERYGVNSLRELNPELYGRVVEALAKTKSVA